VLHSDLKVRNVLLKSDASGRGCVAKVADFGLAVRMDCMDTHISAFQVRLLCRVHGAALSCVEPATLLCDVYPLMFSHRCVGFLVGNAVYKQTHPLRTSLFAVAMPEVNFTVAIFFGGVFVTREHVRHNKSGIAHRGRARINH
jgi:hypothetical protein